MKKMIIQVKTNFYQILKNNALYVYEISENEIKGFISITKR